MKISELSTDKALDVLCELTPYVDDILVDENLLNTLKAKVKPPENATRADLLKIGAEKINKIVPVLLKKKRNDILGILAVLNDKSAEEIGKQNVLITAGQIKDAVKDKDLIDFFKSCADSKENE